MCYGQKYIGLKCACVMLCEGGLILLCKIELSCFATWLYRGTAVAQWLRCYATNRKVTGSSPDGVI